MWELKESFKKMNNKKIEFGDFQTPEELALGICDFLKDFGVQPGSVVEPTCGKGTFVVSALETFPSVKRIVGIDINKNYIDIASSKLSGADGTEITLDTADFFSISWNEIFRGLTKPILLLGNPPWITNSGLGRVDGDNAPLKNNFNGHKGIEAITGKANFDISEWMITHLLECGQDSEVALAMLCKTSVARKVLKYVWANELKIKESKIFNINANKYFGVSVDACLFFCRTGEVSSNKSCCVYSELALNKKCSAVGFYKNELLADIEKYNKWQQLDGGGGYKWRSGVKHDCARVMEFCSLKDGFKNGLNETYQLEEEFLYPLYKSSDVAKKQVENPKKFVLLPQKSVGEDTSFIRIIAPKVWDYLNRHDELLKKRKSVVYRQSPKFSIFGIGKYAFSEWKVVISGLYKKIYFKILPPYKGKPSMVDDTCYLLSCSSKDEAVFLANLLNSSPAKEFLSSLIFWDSKRPITIDILKRLNIGSLAEKAGQKDLFDFYRSQNSFLSKSEILQPLLFKS